MGKNSILTLFDKLKIGDDGEKEVLSAISKMLKSSKNSDNFLLIPKAKISDGTTSREIDIVLLHPVLGLFIIEVKNWKSLDEINDDNNPFEQVNNYKNLMLAHLGALLGKTPINIEYRVVFPSIGADKAEKFFAQNPSYLAYQKHTFTKDSLASKELFQAFFAATTYIIPNNKDFLSVAELLLDKKKLFENGREIVPVITQDEVLFFDHKQLSILNGYTGGFRIIRGVAGTGKTVIMTNYISNRLKNYDNERFLVLCYNKKLEENIRSSFVGVPNRQNCAVHSLFGFFKVIGLDEKELGVVEEKDFNKKFELYKSEHATKLFKEAFKQYIATHPIDYFLCDETQDMPPNIMRVIYEEVRDCIFFIDEAQKFYSYSMRSIAEVFHHPSFEKINMSGHVKNLKNVYRTPSNIAKCAFEILAEDKELNSYYKKSHYLTNDFLHDVNFILDNGVLRVGDFDDYVKLSEIIRAQNDECIILTPFTKGVEQIQALVAKEGKEEHIKVMTMQSIKGLEAKTIVLHNFDEFLRQALKYDPDIFYRKIYVLFTRALENLYISTGSLKDEDDEKIKKVLEVISKYGNSEETAGNTESLTQRERMTAARLGPIMEKGKIAVEAAVITKEIFALVAGFLA